MKKLLLFFLLLALTVSEGYSQPISPYLMGQNAWMPRSYGGVTYNGSLDILWPKVKQSKVKMVRIGGNGVEFNMPSGDEYVKLIDSIRKIGAEPMVQVSQGRGKYTADRAAGIVDYVNNVKGRAVKYWIIGNEPNLASANHPPVVDPAGVASYIKAWATAMKQKDPSISTVGPECASYDNNYYSALVGGAHDITGKDQYGNYYIDIISFHTYFFNGTQTRDQVLASGASGIASNADKLIALMNSANTKHGRTGVSKLQWALTEFNLGYKNPTSNTVEGVGVHSFLNGQYWAEIFNIGMKKQAFSIQPWSIHESGGGRGELDLGYLDGPGTATKPRSSFYHEMIISENFKDTYLSATDNQSAITAFGSSYNDTIAVMVLNTHLSMAYDFTMQLSDKAITSTSPLKINLSAGVDAAYTDRIGGQSSMIFLFNKQGVLLKRILYSLYHAQKNLPPTYLNPGETFAAVSFSADKTFACTTGEQVKFTGNAYGDYTQLSWNFGAGASPQTATGNGPVTVTYSTAGSKTVSFTLTSPDTSITDTKANYITTSTCIREPYFGTPLAIPGTVKMVDYDKGGQFVAYYDTDVVNRGAASDPNVPRKDESVDTGNGAEGFGSVGYSADGEWIKYSVAIKNSGFYKIIARVASLNGGGSLRLSVNDVDKTGVVAVQKTGSFSTYQDLVMDYIYLEESANATLKFDYVKAGFNISNIRFEAIVLPSPAIVVNRVYNGTNDGDGRQDAVELLVVQDHYDMRNLIIKDFDASITTDNGGKFRFNNNPMWQDVRSGTTIVLRKLAGPTGYVQDTDPSDFTVDILFDNTNYITTLSSNNFNVTQFEMVLLKTGLETGVDNAIHAFATRAGGVSSSFYNQVRAPKITSPDGVDAGGGTFHYPLNPTKTANDYMGAKGAISKSTAFNWGYGFGQNNIEYIQSLRDTVLSRPTSLTAISSGNSNRLTWADNSDNESEFEIARSEDGANYNVIASVNANIVNYTDSCLAYARNYSYKVRAKGENLTTLYSSVAEITTGDIPKHILPDLVGECSVTAIAPIVEDACLGSLTATTADSLSYSTQGNYVINWSFDYGNGSISTARQNVIVKDLTAPTVLTRNISVSLVNGSASIASADVDNGSFDACGLASSTVDRMNFDCSHIGNQTVTLTVADKNGNIASSSAIVTVVGSVPLPAIAISKSDTTVTGLDRHTIALGYGAQNVILTARGGTSYSWSPSNNLNLATDSTAIFTPSATGTYPFTVTAVNEYGCSATASITVSVIDVRSGKNSDKVAVCHKGKTLSIDKEGVADHLAHGDVLGTCSSAGSAVASVSELRLTIPTAISSLTASPNPFTSQTDVSFTLAADESSISLDLYNLTGMKIQNVYSGPAKANQSYSFPVSSNISAGVYFFRLSGSNTVLNFKVVKQ